MKRELNKTNLRRLIRLFQYRYVTSNSITMLGILELAEKLKFFSQAQGNGFKRGCVLSRTRPRFYTPKVGFEKVRKIVIFRLFPHPQ